MIGLVLAVGVTAASGLEGLQPDEPEHLRTLMSFDRCVRDALGEPRRPYRRTGNFYEARWCSGAGARADCQIAQSSAHRRDQRAVRSFTLFHQFPRVFGFGARGLRTPAATGWGADVTLAVGGRRIVGDELVIRVARYDAPAGSPSVSMELGARLAYAVHRTELSVSVPGSPREVLAAYTAGAVAFRDLVAGRLDALEGEVLGALDRGEVETCTPGPYRGGGVPPECPPRPLDDAQTRTARARAREHFAAQRALLASDYEAIFAAIRGAFPGRCLPGAP